MSPKRKKKVPLPTPDPESVAKLADGARQFWGARAAEGCRAWGNDPTLAPSSRAEWLAAADLLDRESHP